MTIEGYGPYQIASRLKEEKVLIPSAYLAQHGEGVNKNKTFKDVYGWGSSTICNILEKRAGDLIRTVALNRHGKDALDPISGFGVNQPLVSGFVPEIARCVSETGVRKSHAH